MLGAAEELVQPLGEVPARIPALLELLDAYPRAVGIAGAPFYLAALRDRLPGWRPSLATATDPGHRSSRRGTGRHPAPAAMSTRPCWPARGR